MDLALGAPLAHPVLPHRSTLGLAQPTGCSGGKRCFPKPRFRPFAFAEDLQPRRINDHMRGTPAWPPGNLHRKRCCPSRHVGMIRHRQVELTQAHQRIHQSFRGAVGQLEECLDRQAGLDRSLRVQSRLAAPFGRRRCPLLPDARVVEPDRQTTPIDQSSVVLRPARHPVALLDSHFDRLRRLLLRHDPGPPTAKPGCARDNANILHQRPFLVSLASIGDSFPSQHSQSCRAPRKAIRCQKT